VLWFKKMEGLSIFLPVLTAWVWEDQPQARVLFFLLPILYRYLSAYLPVCFRLVTDPLPVHYRSLPMCDLAGEGYWVYRCQRTFIAD